jgi:hypothetical protein
MASRLTQSMEWLLSLSVWYLSLESSSIRGKLKIPTISVFYISTSRRTVDLSTLWECLPGTPDTGCLGEELEFNGWMTGFFPGGAEDVGSTIGDDGLCPENCDWAHMWDVGLLPWWYSYAFYSGQYLQIPCLYLCWIAHKVS